MDEIIAETSLVGVLPSGEEQAITVQIGRPYFDSEGAGVCRIGVSSIFSKPRSIYGVDTFQALLLALRHVRASLELFTDDGGFLYMKGDDKRSPLSIELLFPWRMP